MTAPGTPGPWHAPHYCRDDVTCNCRSVFSESGPIVATVEVDAGPHGWQFPPPEQARANGFLIAAAPDLYEALEALVLAEEAAGSDGREAERRRAAIAALRKARGET